MKTMKKTEDIYNQLHKKVIELDKRHMEGIAINLDIRNELAKQLREIKKVLPLTYKIGDQVWIKYKRKIKGKVVGTEDRDSHLYEIKPYDTVYKEGIILSDSMLEKRSCDTLLVPELSLTHPLLSNAN